MSLANQKSGMDIILPDDVIVRILSFIPHKDIIRAKHVNRNFARIIRENRVYFKIAKLDVRFYDSNKNRQSFKLWINNRMVEVIDIGNDMVSVKEEDWTKNSLFASGKRVLFGRIFEGQHNLREFFDMLFDMADIELQMLCVKSLDCIPTLIASIECTRSVIRKVTFNLTSCILPQISGLLETVGKGKKTKYYPRFVTTLSDDFDGEAWERFKKLNIIAKSFASGFLEVLTLDGHLPKRVIASIAQNWKMTPFPQFCIDITSIYTDFKVHTWGLTGMTLSFDENSVKMEDNDSENEIEFKKVQKKYEAEGEVEDAIVIYCYMK